MNGDLSGQATREAIEAIDTTVLVAAILPTIVASTIVHH